MGVVDDVVLEVFDVVNSGVVAIVVTGMADVVLEVFDVDVVNSGVVAVVVMTCVAEVVLEVSGVVT